jgi:preprotein translocase subunit YajC
MKTLGINSKLEYTLTGVKATVTAIENDTVLIETEKGEELRSTLAEVNEYLDNGTFKVLEV